HCPGGTRLHWAAGAEGRGVVCSADIATVNLDRKSFTFMRSYPNAIPLSEKGVRAIGAALAPFQFDRVYSHFFERVIPTDAKRILGESIERYARAIGGASERGGPPLPPCVGKSYRSGSAPGRSLRASASSTPLTTPGSSPAKKAWATLTYSLMMTRGGTSVSSFSSKAPARRIARRIASTRTRRQP